MSKVTDIKTGEDKPKKAQRPVIDWLGVEADYCAGQLPLRAIGRKWGISGERVRQVAEREGWKRDPSAKVNAAVAERLILDAARELAGGARPEHASLANHQDATAGGESGEHHRQGEATTTSGDGAGGSGQDANAQASAETRHPPQSTVPHQAPQNSTGAPDSALASRLSQAMAGSDPEELREVAIEAAAELGKRLVLDHRHDAKKARELLNLCLSRVREVVGNADALEQAIDEAVDDTEKSRRALRRQQLTRALSLPNMSAAARDLAHALKAITEVERRAFNLDQKGGAEEAVSYDVAWTAEKTSKRAA